MKEPEKVYSVEELRKALEHKNSMIAYWGAFRLLKDYPGEVRPVLGDFLSSPHGDVQEAGLSHIAGTGAKEYVPRVFQIFRGGTNHVKQACCYPLSLFPNDLFQTQLNGWFQELIHSEDYSRADLYHATAAFLRLDPANVDKVLDMLEEVNADNLKVMVLFQNLIGSVEDREQFIRLMESYFYLRSAYPTSETIDSLIEISGQHDLIQWVGYKISDRFSIKDIYEKSVMLLEIAVNYSERMKWVEIDKHLMELDWTGADGRCAASLMNSLREWADMHANDACLNMLQKKLLWVVQGAGKFKDRFDDSTPKTLETEIGFLMSIPLIFHIETAFNSWLENPAAHTSQIANFYHSSILSASKREQILKFFFPKPPVWGAKSLTVKDPNPEPLDMSQHEMLWALYNGDFAGRNIDWPTFFPNPEISVYLDRCLNQFYVANFDFFVEKKDHLSIDYALRLFQTLLNRDSFELLHKHFDFLFQCHQDVLYQTVCYAPSERFIELLREKYKKGETETGEAIKFLSELFGKETGAEIVRDINTQKDSQAFFPFRLQCDKCQNTFKYIVDHIYIDEARINEGLILDENTVWIDHTFLCKACQSEVPFALDKAQLEKLTNEIKLIITFRLTKNPNTHFLFSQFRIFPFPVYQGVKYTPPEFEKLVRSILKTPRPSEEAEREVLDFNISFCLKTARVFERIEKWEKVIDWLEAHPVEGKFAIEVLSRLGFAYFKLNDYPKAREYLGRVKNDFGPKLANEYEKIYFNQAMDYISLLDTAAASKSRFRVLEGGR